jgi:hypothetical protein
MLIRHRTRSLDYGGDRGEIDMVLDDSEVHLCAGDVLVQQAPTTPGSTAAASPATSRSRSSRRRTFLDVLQDGPLGIIMGWSTRERPTLKNILEEGEL